MKPIRLLIITILILFWACEPITEEDPANPVTINYSVNGVLEVNFVSGTLIGNGQTIPFQFNIANATSGSVSLANVSAGTYALSIQAYTDSLVQDTTTLAYSGQGNYTVIEDVENVFDITLNQILDPDNGLQINFTSNGVLIISSATGVLSGVGSPINFNFAISTSSSGVALFQNIDAGSYTLTVSAFSLIETVSTLAYTGTLPITVLENTSNLFDISLNQILDPDNKVTINFTLNGTLPIASANGTLTGLGSPVNMNFTVSSGTTGLKFFQNLDAGIYNYLINAYSDIAIQVDSTRRYTKSGSFQVIENANNIYPVILQPVDGAIDIDVDWGKAKLNDGGLR